MDGWIKVLLFIIIGIAALSIIGVLLNVLVGLAFLLLKIIFALFIGIIVFKIVQGFFNKLRK